MSKVFSITEGLENLGALRTGGQGSVYKGRRIGPIITAVKLLPTPIHTEDGNDKNFRNFQNEVEKLKKVNQQPNPNVVKILSSGLTESGGFPYIEMEFIEGPDLEELLDAPHDQIFTIKEVLKVADQLANALAHCHLAGVKHGDVKSNNVKYNIHTGNYVLLDFGMAIMSDEQRRTSIRHAGAIEFMAPEQNTGAMYFQTDIYSYGIILFELLAGQVPFPLNDGGETSRNAVMIDHMESPVPDVLEFRRWNIPLTWPDEKKELEMLVPERLLEVINTCLQKDPEKRYATGMALQEALFLSTIERENFVAGAQGLDTLKKQNAALKAQLLDLKAKEANDALFLRIPKRLLVGLVIVMIALLAFGSYGIFKKPDIKVVIKRDTIVKVKRVLVRDTSGWGYRLRQQRLADSIANAADTNNTGTAVHKKKRKKFLGLF
ncbi:MAG TPA: serine/threonine-protein kinase [Mucilaginibacter sp.]|nr:serine/threonine-protein kinase [Mucilaginibacter sp.]